MAAENLEKKRLDADFSILNSLTTAELKRLAEEYEALRIALLNDILDIADRTEMIYRFIRKAEQGVQSMELGDAAVLSI